MKCSILSALLLFALSTIVSAQSSKPAEPSRNGLEFFNQLLAHDEANKGFLVGLKATKTLHNPKFKVSVRGLIAFNNMERKEGVISDFIEINQIYSLGFELQRSIMGIKKIELSALALVGVNLVSELRYAEYSEYSSWSGYYSFEPGISLSYQFFPKCNLFIGSSYVFQTTSNDRLAFDNLNLNFGLQLRL